MRGKRAGALTERWLGQGGREGGGLFLSLPGGHSKSEPDQVVVGAVAHPAAGRFIVSRLAGRAVDYGGGGGIRGPEGEQGSEGLWRGGSSLAAAAVYSNPSVEPCVAQGHAAAPLTPPTATLGMCETCPPPDPAWIKHYKRRRGLMTLL